MSSSVTAVALLLLLAPLGHVPVAGHYDPHTGDSFTYHESIALTNGTGSVYGGYFEEYSVVGTETVTATATNGTESARFDYSVNYSNNSGPLHWTSEGNFTFSAVSFLYVNGTDNQSGLNGSEVWFYMDNALAVGADFSVLTYPMTVESRNTSYLLGSDPGRWVATIYAQGVGSYERNDAYGVFDASYDWKEYFDPTTGYIVGYHYTEQDTNASNGNGFSWTDNLYVTSTSYALTAGTPPAAAMTPSPFTPDVIVALVLVVVVIVVVIAWAASRSRRRPRLPAHSPTGQVRYYPPAGSPPPVRLNPSDQPAVQQIVLRDTVKVNCKYCGTLIDSTLDRCPNCGAPRN